MNLSKETDTLISVVTVSYNAVSTIEQTILSVINQTYPNVEYIIIDGGSTDGTVDIIKKYADKIAYWVSEPDKGIYDAMNKGGLKTTGDFIQFLNAGDWLENEHVIEKIFKDWFKRVDVIYGDMIIRRSDGVYYAKAQDLSHFENDFPLFHPSTFIARSVFVVIYLMYPIGFQQILNFYAMSIMSMANSYIFLLFLLILMLYMDFLRQNVP